MDQPFPPSSRYAATEIATWIDPQGREIRYLRRRFLPPVGAASVYAEHRVLAHDRLDNVTWRYLRDPEQFWRLCDANGAMYPDELTAELHRVLVIPLPEGG
jgi:hypothetical protein